MNSLPTRHIRVLVNRKSGLAWSFDTLQKAFSREWEKDGTDLTYQFCSSVEDGRAKARRAVQEGVQILLVVGGDGTVNTVGSALIGTDTALGVIPVGSGNGLARHFGIPLSPGKAVRTLASAKPLRIDVGKINGRPFLVTCSMAWDAALVRSFNKFPVRGIVPYFLAGIQEFLEYELQEMTIELDNGEVLEFDDAMLCTVANLSQYGGGAIVAPHARPDDGELELIVARRRDMPVLIANMARLFNGSIRKMKNLTFRSFRSVTIQRERPASIQLDGELIEEPSTISIQVCPKCLTVLVPDPASVQA